MEGAAVRCDARTDMAASLALARQLQLEWDAEAAASLSTTVGHKRERPIVHG